MTGSVLAAKYSAPLLLVEKDKLPSETSNVISKEMYYGYILGGEAVITNGLASEIKKQLMEAK
ncbi:cell wall-binding repeat-containing protein [Bacillus coahuilensis]|uniref:cell wall-binding repeat-containing protein n=1 Tax=Bacillus coahuilensis TaxID=408580 RepID=UPI0001850E0D|nr:cell wall-binding repeat-containing protein [Bacillus coahuilensis]